MVLYPVLGAYLLPVTCYGLDCAPSNEYVEALIPIVTMFGDRAFKEIIKVKSQGWGLNLIGLVSLQKEKPNEDTAGKQPWASQEERSHQKPTLQGP